MKKILIIALSLVLLATTADAMPRMHHNTYSDGYSYGYSRGKHDGREQAIKTVAGVSLIVIGAIVIYELGRESRWTATQNGIGYRF